MKPQIIYDMPEKAYHQSSGYGEGLFVTRSMISEYRKSPRGFYLRYVERHPLAQFSGNSSTDFGTIFDMLVSGEDERVRIKSDELSGYKAKPNAFDYDEVYKAAQEGRIIAWPDNLRTANGARSQSKAAKEWQAAQEEHGLVIAGPADVAYAEMQALEKLGYAYCTQHDYDRAILMMREGARDHQIHDVLTSEARRLQPVVRWQDPVTGLYLQIRIDVLFPECSLVDVKTGRKDPSKFLSSAMEFGYDLQDVMYSAGYQLLLGGSNPLTFYFAYFQSVYPYTCELIELPKNVKENAMVGYANALAGIARQDWGEPSGKVFRPVVPSWWYHEYETEVGA